MVDTGGRLMIVLVLAADVSDRDGAALLLTLYHTRFPQVQGIWGDSHYGGPLVAEVKAEFGIEIVVVRKESDQEGFIPLPRRWVVERTLSWLSRSRRLKLDYERNPAYSEAWIDITATHLMLKQLAPDPTIRPPYQRRTAA